MTVESCIPVIPSADLEKSLRLWVDGLGFGVDSEMRAEGKLIGCMLRRGNLAFWLNQRAGTPIKPENYNGIRLYWAPSDIHEMRHRLKDLGYAVSDIEHRDYGQTEFFLTDDDGYSHCFGVPTRVQKANAVKKFKPHRALRNKHLMTIAGAFWRRRFPRLPASTVPTCREHNGDSSTGPRLAENSWNGTSAPRLFEVEPGTQLRGDAHWQSQPRRHPTLVLLHGLEGSSESGYMLGTAEKAYVAGFNVVRLNQRNCGGTERLTPTLYHSGRSADFRAVVQELIERDRLPEIFVAGFSMGGNLVLKMAGEFADSAPAELRGIVAMAPCLDLAACCDALCAPRNFIYSRYFVRSLKRRMRYKAGLFPEIYSGNGLMDDLRRVRNVRDFDEWITARFCGFKGADDYYARSSAMHFLEKIRRPTLILTAQDDPFVPYGTFDRAALRENPHIELLAPQHGGHCAFVSEEGGAERFWAEARIVEFCSEQLQRVRTTNTCRE